ncbi:MAG: hypothetical protein GXY44_11490 [Phycisphaerales bacterium]|nr:hypothetical protein [Phycisphaerales bacterium]
MSFWVGKANASGPVARPAKYLQATSPLVLTQYNFDQYDQGQELFGHELGGFVITTNPASAKVLARRDTVVGALPASEPMAVYMAASSNRMTRIMINFSEPVSSVGFVLMGQDSLRLTVAGPRGESTCTIPQLAYAGCRRWVGMGGGDEEIYGISLEIEAGKEFGMDDLEIGRHAPEPGGLALAVLMFVMWSKVRTNSQDFRGKP